MAAIDAATGRTKWVFDPKVYENGLGMPANDGWWHRSVTYWRDGDDERVVITAHTAGIARTRLDTIRWLRYYTRVPRGKRGR